MIKQWHIYSAADIDAVAADLLNHTSKKKFALYGDMGAGKTTLVNALCKVLGIAENTASPTFAIVNSYTSGAQVFHFDLFRIHTLRELEELGFEDYLASDAYLFIEWPEIAAAIIKNYDFASITITSEHDLSRVIVLRS